MVLLEVNEKDVTCQYAVQAESLNEVLEYLDAWDPDVIVVEEFRLYPWKSKALGWDPMVPSQIIGAIYTWSYRRTPEKAIVVEQPASMRKIGQKHTGELEKTPMFRGLPHAKDALRHAVWFVITHYPRKSFVVKF